MDDLKTELKGELDVLRAEVKSEINGLRTEMGEQGTELKGDVVGLRAGYRTLGSRRSSGSCESLQRTLMAGASRSSSPDRHNGFGDRRRSTGQPFGLH